MITVAILTSALVTLLTMGVWTLVARWRRPRLRGDAFHDDSVALARLANQSKDSTTDTR